MYIEDLPVIIYGKLPKGFTQEIPKEGNPPKLINGKCYDMSVPTHGANGGGLNFCMKDGKAIVEKDQ